MSNAIQYHPFAFDVLNRRLTFGEEESAWMPNIPQTVVRFTISREKAFKWSLLPNVSYLQVISS